MNIRSSIIIVLVIPVIALSQAGPRERGPDGALTRFSLAHPSAIAPFPGDSARQDTYPLPFEGYDPEHTHWRWDHAAIMGGAMTATVAAIHIYQQNAWWSGQRTSFHVQEDDQYALNVDKAGHFCGGAFSSFLGAKSLEWSGVSRDASAVWGSVIGATFELYVEFEDGFAQGWGFSPGDATGDLIGALWMLGQHFVPGMEYFQPKFTYYPSKKFREGLHQGNAIDDYEGQTYWMGIHVHGLLPAAWKPYWPEWLGFAVGASVRNMANYAGASGKDIERNFIISLDYDVTKIIPGDSWFMRTFKEAANFLHYPAPAIRISPGYIAYGLYF